MDELAVSKRDPRPISSRASVYQIVKMKTGGEHPHTKRGLRQDAEREVSPDSFGMIHVAKRYSAQAASTTKACIDLKEWQVR